MGFKKRTGNFICGIYGANLVKAGKVVSDAQRGALFTVLAYGNEKRGNDSWGLWNGYNMIKGLGGITDNVAKLLPMTFGIAHTRRGTCGAVTVANAHPFDIGNIIGAHNGIVYNHDELDKKYNRKHEVDSMHLFSHLNEGLGFDDVRGYGAIEFIEKDNPWIIYLCKLEGGELSVASIKDGENTVGVVWSSDSSHLKGALKTAGINHGMYELETGKVYAVHWNGLFKTNKPDLKLATRTTYEMSETWDMGYVNRGYQRGGRPTPPTTTTYNRFPAPDTQGASDGHSSDAVLGKWKKLESKRKAQVAELVNESLNFPSRDMWDEDEGAPVKIDVPDVVQKLKVADLEAIIAGEPEYIPEWDSWLGYADGSWAKLNDSMDVVEYLS